MATSEASASSLEESTAESCSSAATSSSIQMVSKSVSDRLMGKFFDALQYDFDYEQSGLWSPPIHRKVYLDSPAGNIICSEDEIFYKLKKKAKKACRRRIFCLHGFW
ncbi:hypothetical protein LWI29_024859 [Acer saccharum]|uniref:Uncharacterized protein n=1 Tax=Acer saccharum TaxID=4024 RepID=A0AA39SMZ6_ACESA|nr:hypothetical protein LWI29_024859 [Acer saccharum]KAK1581549.1 hypothetical protein Q3G72_006939 [Acer saccharum]